MSRWQRWCWSFTRWAWPGSGWPWACGSPPAPPCSDAAGRPSSLEPTSLRMSVALCTFFCAQRHAHYMSSVPLRRSAGRSVGLDGGDEFAGLLRLGRGGPLWPQQRGGDRGGGDDQAERDPEGQVVTLGQGDRGRPVLRDQRVGPGG